MRVRPPAVAGLFYPADGQLLLNEVLELLQQAQQSDQVVAQQPRAIIVPHAGYIYSGTVAAAAFQAISHCSYSSIVVIGPNHTVPLSGIAVSDWQGFETPLGLVNNLKAFKPDSPWYQTNNQAHSKEHCLEVLLPFIQVTQPDVEVLPLVIGDIPAQALHAELDAILQSDSLLVISTDLSHSLSLDQAQERDRHTVDRILDLNTDLNGEQACGANAINGALRWAKANNLTPQLLSYDTSATTSGDINRVVGYASFTLH